MLVEREVAVRGVGLGRRIDDDGKRVVESLARDLIKLNPEALRELLRRNAIPEFGSPADVCAAVDSLIRPDSAAITGQILYLGGA